ncbi:ADP-ribosyltransferase [Priestia megaterium]|nr:ADP-ribosyltransferase [Priestia megaterium]
MRYDRYCEETKKPLDREKWDVRNENLKKITERGREEEIKGRKALGEHLDRKLENNNVGEVVTYTSSEGHLTRPDSIGRNSKGEIDLVHDHKHKISDKEHVIHNDSQMRAERELAQGKNGRHVVTISSDKPDLNGIPPKPRPSGPLAKESDIFYTDPSSGRVTHKWEYHPDIPGGGIWIKI